MVSGYLCRRLLLGLVLVSGAVGLAAAQPGAAATLPSGFAETQVATGLAAPTAMAFAPDGRLFVTEQGGRLRVIKNGTLLATPFLTVSVNSSGERGLLGVTFDPNFAFNQYVYVYYTTACVADPQPGQPLHRDGRRRRARKRGRDPRARKPVERHEPQRRRPPLRIRRDALRRSRRQRERGERADARQPAGKDPAPFLRRRDPDVQPVLCDSDGREPRDLGARAAEPVHVRVPAGLRPDADQRRRPEHLGGDQRRDRRLQLRLARHGRLDDRSALPVADLLVRARNGATTGCAITGGAFYNPATAQFPSSYTGDYFFADYCSGWIRKLDPAAGNTVAGFATGIASPVDLAVASDGSLYYLARGSGGAVFRVAYTASQAPSITTHPSNRTVPTGGTATFTVAASGSPRSPISGSGTASTSPARRPRATAFPR